MGEVTGAVIATALVLAAVFVPVAFFPGTTGRLYQQFALTIAVSMAISAFNALTLTPALAALLLAKVEKPTGRSSAAQPDHRRRDDVPGDPSGPHPGALAVAGVFVALLGVTYSSTSGCRPGSCPTRTRATSSSSFRGRRAPRSNTRWTS